jgi:hypothetical protein
MFGVRDHVADVEVVGKDLRVIEEHEAKIQELLRRRVHPAQQDALVPDVAESGVQEHLRRLPYQGGDLLRRVHVRVDGDVHTSRVRA